MKKALAILVALVLVAVVAIGALISQKNTVSGQKDELSKQVESLNAQVATLTEQDKLSKEAADKVQEELLKAQEELEQLKKSAEESTTAIKLAGEEKTKLEAAKLKVEEALNQAQEELLKAQEELEQLKKSAEESTSAIKLAGEEKTKLEKDLEYLKANAEGLEVKASELETAKLTVEETLNQAQTEIKALQDEKVSLKEKLDLADINAKEFETKIAELEAAKTGAEEALNKAQEELKALQEEKTALDEKIKALATEKAELQNKFSELEAKMQEPINLNDEVAEPETSSVVILHTNDVHARVEGNDKSQIGYPRLISIVKELRKDQQVILLDAGDVLHGTAFANLTQGESIVNLMNLAGYNAMTPGNHDFNYGYDRLMELEKQMNFPLINANVTKNGENAFAPYAILKAGEKNIAVIGVANPQIQSTIHPDKIKDLEFKDYALIEKTVEEVKSHADAVVILAHWGANDAYVPNSSVLAKIPGVDLVVDGHSHTPLEEIKQTDNAALVVSAGEHMSNIGYVSMHFTKDGVVCKAETIGFEDAQKYTPDEEAVDLIQKLKAEQQELMSVVIGKTDVLLDGERETNRTGETNLGNLATDALIWYSGAEFAFTNGGGIRTSIPVGDITKGNIIEVFPFGNSVVVIEATGEQILAAMEHGLSKYPETNGGFPHISGGKIVYNPEKAAGERIVEMSINGEPIDKNKKYTLVTNDFTAAGGDGYSMLKDCPVIRYQGTLDEAFIEYIKETGVVNIGIEGRIVQIAQQEPELTEEKTPETVVTP
ncbi:MAG: 5'-nucleotidase C-terminal domain-containing protein [Eubacteriales bacterium]|nr:5'-nucleotidase C-terminal domain-containing protein [Eubacteriales bacterium]